MDAFAILAASLLIFAMIIVIYEIVTRYFFNRSEVWVTEITEYSLLYITFLGTTWLLKREGHIKLDLLLNRLSSRSQDFINILTSFAGLIICAALVWYGARGTWNQFQSGYYTPTLLEIPTAPITVIIPIGSFFLFIQFIRRTYQYWRSWKGL